MLMLRLVVTPLWLSSLDYLISLHPWGVKWKLECYCVATWGYWEWEVIVYSNEVATQTKTDKHYTNRSLYPDRIHGSSRLASSKRGAPASEYK